MHGPDQAVWLDQLEHERGNLRVALDWTITHGDAGTGARLAQALRWFWEVRGHVAEARRQVAALLALPAQGQPSERQAGMLVVAAPLAFVDGDLAAAATLAADGPALVREAGDARARADALLWGARARFFLWGPRGAGPGVRGV